MHYVVISGTRDNYNDVSYYNRRKELQDSGIVLLHYDNLYDYAENLLERQTF